MGVKTTHADYTAMKAEWEKCIDFMASEKEVKRTAKAETYLPRLTNQKDADYLAYKARTPLTLYALRANRAMGGMIGRKEPLIDGLDDDDELVVSVDSRENTLSAYISVLLTRFLTTGRGATLVDMPKVEGQITVAMAEALGIRPRLVFYNELEILDWRTENINNVDVLTMVKLQEKITKPKENYESETQEQYRVLLLENGVYIQRVFDQDENQIDEIVPRMRGKFLDYIPIVFHGGIDVQIPPLNNIVDLNMHHYQLSADEMHGLRAAALPTPYIWGIDPNDPNFPNYSGPGVVIGSDNEKVQTGFREFTGAGLAAVANKLKQMADDIEMMSIQMATEDASQTATGERIDYSSSTSTLAGVSLILSAEMSLAIQMADGWRKGTGKSDVTVKLNTDFIPKSMDANMLAQLLAAYLKGTISYDTYYKNLAVGEITDPHKDPKEELREIEENLPPSMQFESNDDDDDAGQGQGSAADNAGQSSQGQAGATE